MNRLPLIVVFSFLAFCSFVSAQTEISDSDKCYAKCLVPDAYETITDLYPVFTGDASIEEVDLYEKTFEIHPAGTKWEMIDNTWALIEYPAQYKTLSVMRDTTQSVNYEWKGIESRELIERGGTIEWIEVICESDLTEELIYNVQMALLEQGYFVGESGADGILNSETKSVLRRFQRNNELPGCELDFETLEALNIRI